MFTKRGTAIVELYNPLSYQKTRITGAPVDAAKPETDLIEIGPVKLDHTLRWNQGEFRSTLQLMAALTGMPETALRLLTYPDADRVMAAFLAVLPAQMRDDILNGNIPQSPQAYGADEFPQPDAPPIGMPDQTAPPVPERSLADQWALRQRTIDETDEGTGFDITAEE